MAAGASKGFNNVFILHVVFGYFVSYLYCAFSLGFIIIIPTGVAGSKVSNYEREFTTNIAQASF